MISWSTIQSLLLFFGPLILPRALAFYRSLQSRPPSSIRQLPPKTSYALTAIFISALLAFASTLPIFAPANVFQQTQSRLQTSGGVLLTRLATLRSITEEDQQLREFLDAGGLEAALLYVKYGPLVASCPFARPGEIDSGRMYFFYALPSILAPHLFHLCALGVATSGRLSGKEGSRWRTVATIAGTVLAAAEVWLIADYDDRYNIRSTRLSEIDFIYWKMQVWRGLAVATMDGVLGWVIWLQATGRAFVAPLSTAHRIADHGKLLEALLIGTKGLGIIRNATVRDGGMREKVNRYWVKENEVMKDVFEQPEVLEAQRGALRRMDSVRIGRDAESYVDSILGGVQVTREAGGA
ncbi:tail-anchored membrane protein insertion into ER membrane [Teratosphaeria destructans]|uniref:Tail-anchored membrane protein insertion into ER membrane n=1 Tax=Teratosphaeria destructans TaxID=418781 RepID=A0A9W7VYA3_9PEZI|nr:tail-anchored membrane protein insertion into ER membrane [Teratosphaeria destructans]